MEIYLKHTDKNQFIKISSKDKGSVELDIFHNSYGTNFDISHSIYEDEQPDERHSFYSKRVEKCWVQGVYTPKKPWEKSSKAEFMAAYALAQKTLLTITQSK